MVSNCEFGDEAQEMLKILLAREIYQSQEHTGYRCEAQAECPNITNAHRSTQAAQANSLTFYSVAEVPQIRFVEKQFLK